MLQLPLNKKTSQGLYRGKTSMMQQFGGSESIHKRQQLFNSKTQSAHVGTNAPPTTPNVRRQPLINEEAQFIPTLDEQRRLHELQHSTASVAATEQQCVFCAQVQPDDSKDKRDTPRVTFDPHCSVQSPSRRQIVVDLRPAHIGNTEFTVPHLAIRSPSPIKDVATEKTSVNLIKTFRQNELRQKEIKNLLEDVRELNTLSDHSSLNH